MRGANEINSVKIRRSGVARMRMRMRGGVVEVEDETVGRPGEKEGNLLSRRDDGPMGGKWKQTRRKEEKRIEERINNG